MLPEPFACEALLSWCWRKHTVFACWLRLSVKWQHFRIQTLCDIFPSLLRWCFGYVKYPFLFYLPTWSSCIRLVYYQTRNLSHRCNFWAEFKHFQLSHVSQACDPHSACASQLLSMHSLAALPLGSFSHACCWQPLLESFFFFCACVWRCCIWMLPMEEVKLMHVCFRVLYVLLPLLLS